MVGSCAIGCREPCQVLTEAALSGFAGVPQVCLTGVACQNTVRECFVEGRVHDLKITGPSAGRMELLLRFFFYFTYIAEAPTQN